MSYILIPVAAQVTEKEEGKCIWDLRKEWQKMNMAGHECLELNWKWCT